MPVYPFGEKLLFKGTKVPEKIFRGELSKQIIDNYGKGPFEQAKITEIIQHSLNYYIQKFESICHQETSYFFYNSVFRFHEDAIELAVAHGTGDLSPQISAHYFAVYRRILKFIMETGCDVKMTFRKSPTVKDRVRVEAVLDKLIFLGEMMLICVSVYAEQSMIEDVADVIFDKNNFYIFTRRHHYNFLFEHLIEEMKDGHDSIIVDPTGIPDLMNATGSYLDMKYEDVGNLIATMHSQMGSDYEGMNWDALPFNFERFYGIPYDRAASFFKGLTLDKYNKMSLLDLACKPYKLNRYLYKPIIVWNLNGKEFAFVGKQAWTEAIIQYATNAIPWGKAPDEWLAVPAFKSYVHRKEDAHDKWLDDATEAVLLKANCTYDRNVKGLHTEGGYENIDVKGLGEIDFIIVAYDIKKVLIADCKHLLSRYDAANQKNDFNAFTQGGKNYNKTLENKVLWFQENRHLLSEHFSNKLPTEKPFDNYSIEGIFIVNTPTLYMYNAAYRIYTLSQLASVIAGTYTDPTFMVHMNNEASETIINVKYPYFRKPTYVNFDPFAEE